MATQFTPTQFKPFPGTKVGDRGCQCPKCNSFDVSHVMDDELNDGYQCATCFEIGDKYDFTCTVLPTESEEKK